MRELHLQRPRRARRITLVALVDLVIILLIFFMLRTNFLQPHSVDVGTPTKSTAGETQAVLPLTVELHSDGSMWMENRLIDEAELKRNAAQRKHSEKDPAVVAVDGGVKLQRAVAVIDILKGAGIPAVELQRARAFQSSETH